MEIRRRRRKVGGSSAAQPPLAPPMGELASEREPERAQAVANMEWVRRLLHGTLSVTAAPCQLSQRESQGAGFARPVVSPLGKQRRRCAPTMQYRIFYGVIRRYHVGTWYICNIGTPVWPIRFCPEICNGGGRLVAAPTRSAPLNYRCKHLVAL